MALQYDFNNNTGVGHPLAYARVVMVQILQKLGRVEIGVEIFHDSSARSGKLSPLIILGFTVQDLPAVLDAEGVEVTPATFAWTDLFKDVKLKAASKSPVVRAYEWLKLQPEFAGSLDV